MTNAFVVKEVGVGFDYRRRSFSPAAIGNRGDSQLGTNVLRTLRTPSVSRSRSFRLKERYDGPGIRRLYQSMGYPLVRRGAA
jgi:hypothetical protein